MGKKLELGEGLMNAIKGVKDQPGIYDEIVELMKEAEEQEFSVLFFPPRVGEPRKEAWRCLVFTSSGPVSGNGPTPEKAAHRARLRLMRKRSLGV